MPPRLIVQESSEEVPGSNLPRVPCSVLDIFDCAIIPVEIPNQGMLKSHIR